MRFLPDHVKGILLVLASALMYASLPILTKVSYSSNLLPIQTLFLRYLLAALMLAPYILLINKEKISFTSPPVLAQGFFIVLGSFLYFTGLNYMPAGLFSIIFFSYPVSVAALDLIIEKRKPDVSLIAGIILAVSGIAFIGWDNPLPYISGPGMLLALSSSFCYACFTFIGHKNMSDNSALQLIFVFCLLGAGFLFGLSLIQGTLPTRLSFFQLGIIFAMAFFNTILAVSWFLKGVHKIGASWASLLSIAEPVMTLVLAFMLLGEIRIPRELIGSAMIIVSLLMSLFKGADKGSSRVAQIIND